MHCAVSVEDRVAIGGTLQCWYWEQQGMQETINISLETPWFKGRGMKQYLKL